MTDDDRRLEGEFPISAEAAPGVVEQPHMDGPTAHPEMSVEEVRSLAVRGVGVMILRSVAQRGLQIFGNILLLRWLSIETFGLYAIISFLVGMAGFFSDLGVGASFVQRRERLTEGDLRTAFTANFGLNIIFVGALWLLTPLLVDVYNASPDAIWPIRAMSLSILFSTFTAVPVINLERSLRIKQLSVTDIVGQVIYVAVAIPLAYRFRAPGFAERHAVEAVWVLVWAAIAAKAVNSIVLMYIAPWRPRFGWDREAIKHLVRFGLPYQLNGFVNAMKDNFIPTFVALSVGARAVGYLVWAVGMVTNALFLMPIVSRITFPAFARLQHDEDALRDAIERSIRWISAAVIPTTMLLAAFARQLVEHVYGPKWEPGLPSFYLLCIPMINAAYSTVMVSALFSVGRAKVVLRLTLIWASAGWLLGVPLTLAIGLHGFALAMSIVSWLSILSVREMNKVVKVRFVPGMVKISILAGIPSLILAGTARFVVRDSLTLMMMGLAGILFYVALMLVTGELDEPIEMIKRKLSRATPVDSDGI